MLANKLLVVSPLIFISSIGARSRISVDAYDFPACTRKQHQAILAYRQPFIEVSKLKGTHANDCDRAQLRRTAKLWIEGSESGTLIALTPAFTEDFVRDGIKQQIHRAANVITTRLKRIARAELQEKNPAQAASDLLMALRMCEVLKYSDPYAMSQGGMQQRSCLNMLLPVTKTLPAAEAVKAFDQLTRLREKQRSVTPLIRIMRQLYFDACARKEQVPALIPGVETFVRYTAVAKAKLGLTQAKVANTPPAFSGAFSPMVGTIRMASVAQEAWLNDLDQALIVRSSVVKHPKQPRLVASAP